MTHQAIIPYAIISSLSQLDNIFETRLFGWVLAKAQSVLKLYNKDLGDINLQHAMDMVRCTMPARYLLQPGDTNYRNIIKAFTLANKTVEYEREDRLYHLNIIAFPELIRRNGQQYVTFVIHNELWHALLNFSKGYRLVSLPTYMSLKSTYSVIMYILISQQSDPITYHTDTLKRILGADKQKAYQRNSNFFAKVLDAAKRELDDVSPYTFHYSAQRTGRGGTYANITIIPTRNQAWRRPGKPGGRQLEADKQRIRLDERVTEYIMFNFAMSAAEVETIEGMMQQRGGFDAQMRFLATVKTAAATKRVSNPAGYLVQALRNAV